MKHKYKDKCDLCNKWDYCKGFRNLVLCDNCRKKETEQNQKEKTDDTAPFIIKGQTNIYDYL